MLRYLIKRLLIAVPVLLGVTMISYMIISLAPGDAVSLMVDPNLSQADLDRRRAELGLDQPVVVRYAKWLGELAQGNLGYSYTTSQPVTQRIGERLGPTLMLGLTSLALAYVVAIPLGIVSATRQYSIWDYGGTILALVGVSIPNFFLGMGLIYVLGLKLDLLPISGMYKLGGTQGLGDLLQHLVMPAIVLGSATMGSVTRNTRSAMLDVVRQDFVRTARSKGISGMVIMYKHALRNALLPIITLLGLSLPAVLGGAVITEQIFSWPGMGLLTIEAISSRDYPVLMGLNLMVAVLVVVGGLVTDLLYSWADPRIRYT